MYMVQDFPQNLRGRKIRRRREQTQVLPQITVFIVILFAPSQRNFGMVKYVNVSEFLAIAGYLQKLHKLFLNIL